MAPLAFGEVAEQLRRSTVQVQSSSRAGGSGVIWSTDGDIITNAHVIQGPKTTVGLWDGRRLEATVIARDTRRDLAALRAEASALPAPVYRDSSDVRVGELAIAVGNPLGFIGALTTGVVHAVGPLPGLSGSRWIQADVRLAPGNSGGPLADAQGRVIGINTMVAGGLGLAVPSNTIAAFMQRRDSGIALGVTIRPVRVPLPGASSLGLWIAEIEAGSLAAHSSLAAGDVIIGAEGSRFRSLDDLHEILQSGGDTVTLQVLRRDAASLVDVPVALHASQSEAA